MTTPLPVRGVCFGFEVHSEMEVRFLRRGRGVPVTVTTHSETDPEADEQLVVEWKPRSLRPFHGRVYQNPSGRYRVWTSDAGWFLVDPAKRHIAVEQQVEALRREVRLLTTPMLLMMIERGLLPFHASAVEVDGKAVLFGAPSRFGKTTIAAGFHAAGFRVLAEDVTGVQVGDGPVVLPGPALLRVRRDVAERLDFSGTRLVGEDTERSFLAIEPDRAGAGEPVPLGAVVLLRGEEDKVRLERVAGVELLRDLWALAFKLPTDPDFERCFAGITVLSERVPIWNLHQPFDLERLPGTVQHLASSVSAG